MVLFGQLEFSHHQTFLSTTITAPSPGSFVSDLFRSPLDSPSLPLSWGGLLEIITMLPGLRSSLFTTELGKSSSYYHYTRQSCWDHHHDLWFMVLFVHHWTPQVSLYHRVVFLRSSRCSLGYYDPLCSPLNLGSRPLIITISDSLAEITTMIPGSWSSSFTIGLLKSPPYYRLVFLRSSPCSLGYDPHCSPVDLGSRPLIIRSLVEIITMILRIWSSLFTTGLPKSPLIIG